ncbi:U-box domain-containing protein 40 [Nymphaea thermarum]|nr:U-box domain-containing protein 40 [Nymphaea thermarum]
MRKFLNFHHRQQSTTPVPEVVPASTPTVFSWPPEFLCPLSSQPMSDPIILSSGQSYERNCIFAWIQSGQTACYLTEQPLSPAELSCSFVPNVSLRSAIHRFCQSSRLEPPSAPSNEEARLFVANLLPEPQPQPLPPAPAAPPVRAAPVIQPRIYHSATNFNSGNSGVFPLPLSSRPSHRDEPPPEDTQDVIPCSLAHKLRSYDNDEQAAAAREIRQLTRSDPASRLTIASDGALLSALLQATASPDSRAQSDSVATVVNLSLERESKVLLVRAGVLQFLIDALRSGCSEARGHAVAALFSLAVEEENRIVIGVIGAIPLLLRLVGTSGAGDRATAEDAAMALYYLSLERGNKAKMIREGAVPMLVRRARGTTEGEDAGSIQARCFMILCNLTVGEEGRRSLLGSDALAAASEAIEMSTGAGPVEEQALALMLLLVGKGNGRYAPTGLPQPVIREVTRLAQQGKGRIREKATALLMLLKEAQAAELPSRPARGGDWDMMPPPPPAMQDANSITGPKTAGF